MADVEIVIDQLWDGQPARADETVTVRLEGGGDDFLLLHIDAPFHGDPAPEAPAGPTWALWEHEVVELFVLGLNERYLEVEVGPHGHHLVLRLVGVRNATERLLPLAVDARIDGDRWTATAWIPRGYLPTGASHLNATAVHGVGEARRYLSWAPLPGDAPDFHRIEAFRAVTLPQ